MTRISRDLMRDHVHAPSLSNCLGQMLMAEWLAKQREIEALWDPDKQRPAWARYRLWAASKDIGPDEEEILWRWRICTGNEGRDLRWTEPRGGAA